MDASLYRWFNSLADRTQWLHPMGVAYAKFGVGLLVLLLLLGAWLIVRREETEEQGFARMAGVAWAGLSAVVALGLNQVIGKLVGRARPYTAMPAAHVLIARTHDFSFPSDHACVMGAVAAGLWLVDRRLGIAAGVAALAMAVARVYVGVHYPGDVLAGLVVGGAVAAIGWIPARWFLVPAVRWIARTPAGVLVYSGRS
ncbi:MAG TPA: phosphatase PAP2 family protein [Actinomycetota bacterium]|nr:phosphatase PAP2 family protein [Actinomycetota bacterium]